MKYQTNKYDTKPLKDRGIIRVYALGSIAAYLATKFDHKELMSDDVSRNDILAIMVRFLDGKRIKTEAGAVDKSGEFYFRKLFEQGDTVPESDEFLLDKWTAKNISYVLKNKGRPEFEKQLHIIMQERAEEELKKKMKDEKDEALELQDSAQTLSMKFLDSDSDEVDENDLQILLSKSPKSSQLLNNLQKAKLVNNSNACYMNATMQSLYALETTVQCQL